MRAVKTRITVSDDDQIVGELSAVLDGDRVAFELVEFDTESESDLYPFQLTVDRESAETWCETVLAKLREPLPGR